MAKRKRFYCNSGSRIAEKHAVRIDDCGHKTLVKTGEVTDIYIKIQSHKDECDIEKILARADAEGYEVLNKREAFSGDVTMVPNSLLEAAMMLQDRENEFNQLPIDIRREFNFNFNEYIAEAGKDPESWSKKMGIYNNTAPDPLPEEEAPAQKGGEE